MPSAPADRDGCRAAQAELLRALVHGGPFPAGFDAAKAASASRSLRAKRARAVAAAWPALGASLAERFDASFDAYARTAPPPPWGHGVTDGLVFARTLPRAELTGAIRVELLYARSRVTARLRPRRGVFAGAIALRDPRRILVVVRLPGAAPRAFAVSAGRTT